MSSRGVLALVLAVFLTLGCQKQASRKTNAHVARPGPAMKAAWMPAALGEATFGVTDEATLVAAWPSAERKADRVLGGHGVVLINGRPAVRLRRALDTAHFVEGLGEGPRLVALSVLDPALCRALGSALAEIPEATRCLGTNREFGPAPGGWEYCVGTRDRTHNLFVGCRRGVVSYQMMLR